MINQCKQETAHYKSSRHQHPTVHQPSSKGKGQPSIQQQDSGVGIENEQHCLIQNHGVSIDFVYMVCRLWAAHRWIMGQAESVKKWQTYLIYRG